MKVDFSGNTYETHTQEQRDSLLHLQSNPRCNQIVVYADVFLPDGYIAFIQKFEDGGQMNGGISMEGDIST